MEVRLLYAYNGLCRYRENAVHEILQSLPTDSIVLDLGSGKQTFDSADFEFVTARVDIDRQNFAANSNSVQADAAHLPFAGRVFSAVVANHSLEHLSQLEACLSEITRVLQPSGALFVSVPDATTLTDRLYRWLAQGGGHLNPFSSSRELLSRIESATGLKNAGVRPLCTSLSFLNRRNRKHRPPRKIVLFAFGSERFLFWLNYLLRLVDRLFRTRLSLYGWAIYFGEIGGPVSTTPWVNVCVRCGAGHPSDWISSTAPISRAWFFIRTYRCPCCGARNSFWADRSFSHLA